MESYLRPLRPQIPGVVVVVGVATTNTTTPTAPQLRSLHYGGDVPILGPNTTAHRKSFNQLASHFKEVHDRGMVGGNPMEVPSRVRDGGNLKRVHGCWKVGGNHMSRVKVRVLHT